MVEEITLDFINIDEWASLSCHETVYTKAVLQGTE